MVAKASDEVVVGGGPAAMMLAAEVASCSSCIEGDDVSVLAGIRAMGVNVAVLRRVLDPRERADLAQLAADGVGIEAELEGHGLGVEAALASLRAGPARELLMRDAASLVRLFASLVERRHVRFSLASVTDDACRKWHVDYVGLRLVATYAGPGTLWVEDQDADRRHLGRADLDYDANNALVLPIASRARSASAGDVVLLKGEGYRGAAGRGAIHRSPPIADGAPRLVMKIDVLACGC